MLIKVLVGMGMCIVFMAIYTFVETETEPDVRDRASKKRPQILDEGDVE